MNRVSPSVKSAAVAVVLKVFRLALTDRDFRQAVVGFIGLSSRSARAAGRRARAAWCE